MHDTNREGNPVSLANLIAELEAATGAALSSREAKHRIWTAVERLILRGDVYYADLRPAIGSEQDGVRPVLVVQNNVGNRHSPTVIVAAITSRRNKARLPTHVGVGRIQGMDRRSIHASRKWKRYYAGTFAARSAALFASARLAMGQPIGYADATTMERIIAAHSRQRKQN